jgi:hypothetical protein
MNVTERNTVSARTSLEGSRPRSAIMCCVTRKGFIPYGTLQNIANATSRESGLKFSTSLLIRQLDSRGLNYDTRDVEARDSDS